jgi:hypothetical protein
LVACGFVNFDTMQSIRNIQIDFYKCLRLVKKEPFVQLHKS